LVEKEYLEFNNTEYDRFAGEVYEK